MLLSVHVKPNAKETKFVSWLDDQTAVIALHAAPEDNRANEELVDFLSGALNIPKSFVYIKSGHTSRFKRIELPDGTSMANLRHPL